MSKTPVSMLQEYCVKERLGLPDWSVICKTSGVNVNVFTYKVTCGKISATGTALTKKEAKQLAAKEMLKLLPGTASSVQSFTTFNCETGKNNSNYSCGSGDGTHDDTFINSVGKLNEYCVLQKLKTPEYRDSAVSGRPAHSPLFTVVCKIGKLELKGESNTKKKAKHDAAQNMLDELVRNTDYTDISAVESKDFVKHYDEIRKIDTLDLAIEQPSISVIESSERAKQLFPKLKRYRGFNKLTCSTSVNESHLFFQNSYESFVCETVRLQLNDNTSRSKGEILNNITSLLGLRIDYSTLSSTQDRVVVLITLNSKPSITDAGVAETYLDARDQAIVNLLDTIDIYLT